MVNDNGQISESICFAGLGRATLESSPCYLRCDYYCPLCQKCFPFIPNLVSSDFEFIARQSFVVNLSWTCMLMDLAAHATCRQQTDHVHKISICAYALQTSCMCITTIIYVRTL